MMVSSSAAGTMTTITTVAIGGTYCTGVYDATVRHRRRPTTRPTGRADQQPGQREHEPLGEHDQAALARRHAHDPQNSHVLDTALDHGDQRVTNGADGQQGQEHRQHLHLSQFGHLRWRLGRLQVRAGQPRRRPRELGPHDLARSRNGHAGTRSSRAVGPAPARTAGAGPKS
jgi:hypothetical protein